MVQGDLEGARLQQSTLRRSKRVFGASLLVGCSTILGFLLFLRAPLDLVVIVGIGMASTAFAVLRRWPPRPPHPRVSAKGTRSQSRRSQRVSAREDRSSESSQPLALADDGQRHGGDAQAEEAGDDDVSLALGDVWRHDEREQQ